MSTCNYKCNDGTDCFTRMSGLFIVDGVKMGLCPNHRKAARRAGKVVEMFKSDCIERRIRSWGPARRKYLREKHNEVKR